MCDFCIENIFACETLSHVAFVTTADWSVVLKRIFLFGKIKYVAFKRNIPTSKYKLTVAYALTHLYFFSYSLN